MNSIEKELFGFMGEAERMSGFDSYDSADGMDDSFDYNTLILNRILTSKNLFLIKNKHCILI